MISRNFRISIQVRLLESALNKLVGMAGGFIIDRGQRHARGVANENLV